MVPLHVAVVVGARHVGRVEIDKVDTLGLEMEHVGTFHGVAAAVVEDNPVEGFDLLEEMLLDRESQITPPVVVPGEVAGDGEDAPRLLLQTRTDE